MNVRRSDGAIAMLPDDVLLQARTKHIRQELGIIATAWQHDRHAKWSATKCRYMKKDKERGEVRDNGQALKESDTEVYLRMKLGSGGLKDGSSRERGRKGGKDVSTLLSQGWRSTGLQTSQVSTLFNAHVRWKYRYRLSVVGICTELLENDERWEHTAIKALLKTRTNV